MLPIDRSSTFPLDDGRAHEVVNTADADHLAFPAPLPFEEPLPIAKGYPERFVVPKHKRAWERAHAEYSPPEYEAPRVLQQDRTKTPGGWADPANVSREELLEWSRSGYRHSFEGAISHDPDSGRPLNPLGRVGISGRGALGKWGPNHAADALLTRIHPHSGLLEVLLIQRQSGEWAIPGGMVDTGENPFETARRELTEETGLVLDETNGRLVYQGIGDGPRLTDNAWIETSVYHFHIDSDSSTSHQKLEAASDAMNSKWCVISAELVRELYANHGSLLSMALTQFETLEPSIPSAVREQLRTLPHEPLLTSFSELRGRVGIFGGSFDPVHSRRLKEMHSLDSVVFVPAARNPLKHHQTDALPQERIKMLEHALRQDRGIFVSPHETRREGPSYTIDLLDSIRAELPREQAQLFLIVGADCVTQLPLWRQYGRILQEAGLIPCSRQGYRDPRKDAELLERLSSELGAERTQKALRYFTELPIGDLSSTQIRAMLKRGDMPRGIPSAVVQVIEEYGLYR
jgi:ADP-ribose pyrophosphatase